MLWPAGQSAYGWWSQRSLRANWQHSVATVPPKKHRTASLARKTNVTKSKPQIRSDRADTTNQAPFPPTRIVIPGIGLDAVVVQGMDSAALSRGPGHDPHSAAPGQPGNCVIAAHSNIYGAWFGNLDQLWAGSTIELHTPRQNYKYTVLTSVQVSQSDTSVLAPAPDGTANLTLITCTKPASIYRHVVTAVLNDNE